MPDHQEKNLTMQKNIKLLTLFNFCNDFVFFAPIAIIYFAKVTGSYSLGMSIFSVVYISSAVFEVPTGILSDYIGRKKTMIFGSIFSILCIIFYAIGGYYWILVLGALSQGISSAFFSGNNDAFLRDTLRDMGKESEYHTYLGKTNSTFQVALGLASVIGGFLATRSFSLVVWISVFPQISCLIISFFLKEPTVRPNESGNIYVHLNNSFVHFKENYKLRLLTITSAIRFAVSESSYFLESAFVNMLWPIWGLGVFGLFQHILGATGYYFSGKFINRFGALRILFFENIINRILSFTALFYPSLLSPGLIASASFPWGAGMVAENSLLQKEFTEKQRATMGSLNSLFGSITFGIFSIILGFLGDKLGVRNALLIATITLFIPLYLYRKIFINDKDKVPLN